MLYEDESKNTDLIRLLGSSFIARRDVKAMQHDDGAWMPVREDMQDNSSPFLPWTMMDFKFHLGGQRTYGHYLLDTDNKCKLFAFDLDVVKPNPKKDIEFVLDDGEPSFYNPREVWMEQQTEHPAYPDIHRQLTGMAMALTLAIQDVFGSDIKVAVCDTGGKGLHVYALYGDMPATVARKAANGVLEKLGGFTPTSGDNFFMYSTPENPNGYSAVCVEVFPKQDKLTEDGLGNLMAMPCGVHQVTKRPRSLVRFLSTADDPDASKGWATLDDPIEALEGGTPWS